VSKTKRYSEEERRALGAFVKLMRAASAVSSRIGSHLAGTGLTHSQFGVLEALYHLGPMCQRELAEKILKTSGNITLVIDNLEKSGLAVRTRAEEDRRYVTVSLTDEGEALISRIFPAHAGAVVEEFRSLTPDQQDTLAALCRKLGKKE
jgi:MarR family 2-MHQ and catechol resistance regulon transcriptional repressor